MAVYLDYNATTPLDERVLEAMLPYLSEVSGNPSSVHRFGRAVRGAVDQAREQVAALVGAHPSQVIFTSGGTEANNLALKGTADRLERGRLAVSAIEHASLLGPAEALSRHGWVVDRIPVDGQCRVTRDALLHAIGPETRLVSVMMANNETGAIQDIAVLSDAARTRGVVVHTDAVQAPGKIPVDFKATGVHLMSLSAHKLYGPQGAGALVIDKSLELEPLLHGGGQERGLRAGTENVAGIVGFGTAAALAGAELEARGQGLRLLRDGLEALVRGIPGVVLFAEETDRLPNTVQLSVPGIDGETLLMELDRRGVAVSSGSACSSGRTEPSHVLLAMGVDPEVARGSIRVSLGKDTTPEHVETFTGRLREVIARFKSVVGLAADALK